MKVTKLNVKSSSDKKNRKNALPRTIGLVSLALGVVLSSFGLWTHFHGESGPTIATYKDDNVYVTASYGEDANIPKDAEMRAYLVTPETDPDEYSQKVMSAITAIGGDDETAAENVIYDIGFYVGDAEIEPAAPVAVTIQDLNDGFIAGEDIAVVHLGEDDVELLADASVDGNGIVSFTSDRFSEFVLLSDSVLLADNDGDYYGIVTTAETERELVAHFKFEGNLTNSADGYTNKVTAKWDDDRKQTSSRYGDDSSGISNRAVQFPGDKYINVEGLDNVNFSQGATISYWSMITKTSNMDWGYVWGDTRKEQEQPRYTGTLQGGSSQAGKVFVTGYGRASNNINITADGYSDTNKWHMITVVYSGYDDENDKQTMSLYVDGICIGTVHLNVNKLYLSSKEENERGINLKDYSFHIGGNVVWGEFNQDYIDEFKIYNYAQSGDEIRDEYKSLNGSIKEDYPIVWFDGTLGSRSATYNSENYYPGTQDWVAPDEYFVENDKGELCVRLPGVDEIGTSSVYRYTLAGWYDIYSGAYYDYEEDKLVRVEDLGDNPSHNTVFYACWWSENYSFVRNRKEGIVAPEKFTDANTFVTTHVFDYNELYNAGKANVSNNGLTKTSHKEDWNKKEEDGDVIFFNWDAMPGRQDNLISSGRISFPSGNEDQNRGGANSRIEYGGKVTPNLWRYAEELFQTVNLPYGVNYLGEGDYLYQYDTTSGYYYYDSVRNAASYDKNGGRFYVYNSKDEVRDGNGKYPDRSDFLPLNGDNYRIGNYPETIDGTYAYEEKDGSINYWFGFSSTINFYLGEDVGDEKARTNQVNSGNGVKDTTFTFSGDDDVWVFVDDTPVLDLGGIHGVVFGSINFSTGEVRHSDLAGTSTTASIVSNIPVGYPPEATGDGVITYNIKDKFGNKFEAGKHTLTIYYMERGSSQSNCAVYFNLRPDASIQIEKQDDVTGAPLTNAGFTLQRADENYQPKEYYCLKESNDSSETMKSFDWVTKDVIWDGWDGDWEKFKPDQIIHFSDEKGVLTFYGLRKGNYILTERVAPSGYEVNSTPINITIIEEGTYFGEFKFSTNVEEIEGWEDKQLKEDLYSLTVSFPNKPDYLPLQIVKYGEGEASPLSGVKFKLSIEDDEAEDGSGRTLLGILSFVGEDYPDFTPSIESREYKVEGRKLVGLMAGKTYYLEEEDAPEGYEKLSDVEFKFEVKNNDIEFVGDTSSTVDFDFDDNLFEESWSQWSRWGKVGILKLTDPKIKVKVELLKVDGDASGTTDKLLPGATFELYAADDGYSVDNSGQLVASDNATGSLWTGTSMVDKTSGNLIWVEDENAEPVVFVEFPELIAGKTYYLVETEEPDQYNKLDSVIIIEVKSDGEGLDVYLGNSDDKEDWLTQVVYSEVVDGEEVTIIYYKLTVPNSTGYELPETGGHGTLVYILTGFMLVLGSAIVLVTKRRLRCTR